MLPYSRRQLAGLLGLVAAAGAGLAIDHWRHAHPELVARLERLDHDAPPAALAAVAAPEAGGVAPPATRRVPAPPRAPARASRAAPAPPALPRPLDLNGATAEDLQGLPGVGPTLAARIVASRETQGPFTAVDELRRVRGVGPRTLDRLRDLLAVAE